MLNRFFYAFLFFSIITGIASASANYEVTVDVKTPIEITSTQPSIVRTNQHFDVTLQLTNFQDMELFDITIQETMPEGYKLKQKTIYPQPLSIGEDDGYTIIYWNIDRLANKSNMTLGYTILSPKSAGEYTFRTDALGTDVFDNKYVAYNITEQVVKKPPIWKRILKVFEFFT